MHRESWWCPLLAEIKKMYDASNTESFGKYERPNLKPNPAVL